MDDVFIFCMVGRVKMNLDNLFRAEMSRINLCEYCGGQGTEVSHFKGRGRYSVRFDLENCDWLCRECHAYFHREPKEYHVWKLGKLGIPRYERLMAISEIVLYPREKKEIVKQVRKDIRSGVIKKQLKGRIK